MEPYCTTAMPVNSLCRISLKQPATINICDPVNIWKTLVFNHFLPLKPSSEPFICFCSIASAAKLKQNLKETFWLQCIMTSCAVIAFPAYVLQSIIATHYRQKIQRISIIMLLWIWLSKKANYSRAWQVFYHNKFAILTIVYSCCILLVGQPSQPG